MTNYDKCKLQEHHWRKSGARIIIVLNAASVEYNIPIPKCDLDRQSKIWPQTGATSTDPRGQIGMGSQSCASIYLGYIKFRPNQVGSGGATEVRAPRKRPSVQEGKQSVTFD